MNISGNTSSFEQMLLVSSSHLSNSSVFDCNISYIDGVPANQMDPSIMTFRKVVHMLDLYFVPCIAVLGILGNMISFLVFVATYLKHMSSSVYLAGLAVSDSIFLFVVLISWSNNIGNHTYHRHGWCHLFVYLAYVSSFLSVWYVACFTVERHIAVCFPLKRQDWCTASRARATVAAIAGLALILYTFALWTTEVIDYYGRPFCSVMHKHFQLVTGINNVDTLITLILPTLIIVICNVRIAYALANFFMHSRYHDMENQGQASLQMCALTTNCAENSPQMKGSSNNTVYHHTRSLSIYSHYVQSSSYNRLQMRVTKMLLLVSTAFLICNIPSHAIRVYAFFMTLIHPSYTPSHKFVLVQKIMQFVYYCNFSINFLLYNISGKAFRRALFRLLCLMKRRLIKFIQIRIFIPSPNHQSIPRCAKNEVMDEIPRPEAEAFN